jgi:triosephosphate isomerase
MILAANWKMNKTAKEAREFVRALAAGVKNGDVTTVILPPYTAISAVAEACGQGLTTREWLAYGAQNVYFESSGAFTGEVSVGMLADLGCRYVACGHSERRKVFGESDEWVGKKVRKVLDAGMIPIFCVGETLDERKSGQLESVLTRQVNAGLDAVKESELGRLTVAYEPVWAIGTGVVATPDQAEEAHRFVRQLLVKKFGAAAGKVPILYGGSVTPENARSLVSLPTVDGALVGGASLKIESFLALHQACVEAQAEKAK